MSIQSRVNDKIGYQLIHTFSCNKLSQRAEGKLHYELWQHQDDQSFGIAISKNESSGGFSTELILVSAIIECLAKLLATNKPFHATAFKPLFIGKSSNNHSFLAAVLIDQLVIKTHPLVERLLDVDADYELWPIGLESHIQAPKQQQAAISPDQSLNAVKQGKKKQGKVQQANAHEPTEQAFVGPMMQEAESLINDELEESEHAVH